MQERQNEDSMKKCLKCDKRFSFKYVGTLHLKCPSCGAQHHRVYSDRVVFFFEFFTFLVIGGRLLDELPKELRPIGVMNALLLAAIIGVGISITSCFFARYEIEDK